MADILILSAFIIILVLIGLFFRYKSDIIEIFEVSIRYLVTETLCVIWILGVTLTGIFFASFIFGMWWIAQFHPLYLSFWGKLPPIFTAHISLMFLPFWGAFQLIVFFYPLLLFLYLYTHLEKYYARKFRPQELKGPSQSTTLNSVKGKLKVWGEELGVKYLPKVVYSSFSDIPSYIYGRESANSTLVLPRNFAQLIEFSVNKHPDFEKAKEALLKFTLLHELSHIKNKDIAFTSIIIPFLQGVKFWPFLALLDLVLSTIVLAGLPLQGLAISFMIIQIFLLVLTLILVYLLFVTSNRHKEFLADARAAIYLSPEKLNLLLGPGYFPSLRDRSLLEVFFWLTTRGSIPIRGFSLFICKWVIRKLKGFGKPVIGSYLRYLLDTHPSSTDRIRALNQHKFWNKDRKYPSFESAFFTGLSVATLILVSGMQGEMIALWQVMFKQLGLITFPFLLSPPVLYFGYIFFGVLGSLFLITAVFSSPVANSSHWTFKWIDFRFLLFRYLVVTVSSAVLFYSTVGFIFLIGEARIQVGLLKLLNFVYWMVITGGGLIFIPMVFAALYTIQAVVKEGKFFSTSSTQKYTFLPASFFGLSVIIWVFFRYGTGPEFYTYAEFFFLFSWVVFEIILQHFSPIYFSGMEILHFKIASWHWRRRMNKQFYILISSFLISIFFLLPLFLWQFIFKSLMIEASLDNFFYPILGGILTLFLLELYLNPVFRTPALQQLFYLVSIYFSYIDAEKNEKAQRFPNEAITEKIYARKTAYGSYSYGPLDRFGSMDQTYYAMRVLRLSSSQVNLSTETMDWILSCECPHGGFSRFKGGKPRLSSTHQALVLLTWVNEGLENIIDKGKHRQWVLSRGQSSGAFICPFSGEPHVEDIYHAFCALSYLGHNLPGEEAGAEALELWRKGKQSVKDTFYLLYLLSCLDMMDSGYLLSAIKDRWYPLIKHRVLNTHVDKQWEDLYFFDLINASLGYDRPEVLRPEVNKRTLAILKNL